jgi:hypothetical protein
MAITPHGMGMRQHVTRKLLRQGWKVGRIGQHALEKFPHICPNRILRALGL